MKKADQVKLVQDYVNLLGKTYVILLGRLDEFLGAPLSTNEKVVLQVLDEEPISIKEVSLRTGLALSTLTNVFDKMEARQLVRRCPSQTDRRMVNIELEVAGRTLKSRFNELIRQISVTLLDILPEDDRDRFMAALEKTSRAMSNEERNFQETLGSLLEPMQRTLASHFKEK